MVKFSETREPKSKKTYPLKPNRADNRAKTRDLNRPAFPATVEHKGRVTKSSRKP